MLEHFINAALSKSWIEAQPLPPRLSVSGRGTEIDIKRATISLSRVCEGMPEVNKMALRFSTDTRKFVFQLYQELSLWTHSLLRIGILV